MNVGYANYIEPMDDPAFITTWILPIVEAGGGGIPFLPHWKVGIVMHNEFAVFQVYFGESTIVTSNYVAWTRKGANKAWNRVRDAYVRQLTSMTGPIPDSYRMREKPLSSKWIVTLTEPAVWNVVVAKQTGLLAAIKRWIARAIVENNSSKLNHV